LDQSTIDELPPGRTPVTTVVLENSRRQKVLERIRAACKQGRQAYWVCALIDESEVLQCQAAEKMFELLQQSLPELKVALVHGRMKSVEKETVMQAFKNKEFDLLVATTVIEVGVDVPNASLMVIENAERFGLAQLHQLRGRVGRGSQASHCVLLYQSHLSKTGVARLEIMKKSTYGFVIAQKDLEIRGPGEVLGTKQTGEVDFKIADLLRDKHLLELVRDVADEITEDYPEQAELLVQRWLHGAQVYGRV
jgi:ATP-dependent DNA helicase RecG